MASVNKAIIVGNLGKDPELRYTAGGDAVCNITVATSESWKDKTTGEKKEITEWHRIVFYRKLAEIANQYLEKGSSVYIEGRIRTRKWQDKDGQDRYTTEIEATEMKMLGGRPAESKPRSGEDGYNQPEQRRQPPAGNRPKPSFDDLGDDIPL